jgi:glycosyltransferase involved in cell wall biosynthesis
MLYIRSALGDSLRIGFVSHVFWPETRRGGERLIRDLSDALVARGHRPRLVTSHRGRPSRADQDGLEVVRQWRPPERPFNRLGFPPGTSQIPLAWWALRRGEDDVVQAWTPAAGIAVAHSGKPSVLVFQGVLHDDDLRARPRVRQMLMRAARGCDAVVTYGLVAAQEFTRHTGVEARAINPGIRLDAFTPGGERADHPVIFCAADPDEPRKRVGLLVEAFQHVREARPDAELWLMPAGDRGLRPGVKTVDPGADREALVELYRSAWVTVLPAFREAFGLVAIESLACGTPVLVGRDGGEAPRLIDGVSTAGEARSNEGASEAGDAPRPSEGASTGGGAPSGRIGAVFETARPDDIAATLLETLDLTSDPSTATACRRRAEDFPIDLCAERYIALYRELSGD